jgi:hypothetical protein
MVPLINTYQIAANRDLPGSWKAEDISGWAGYGLTEADALGDVLLILALEGVYPDKAILDRALKVQPSQYPGRSEGQSFKSYLELAIERN